MSIVIRITIFFNKSIYVHKPNYSYLVELCITYYEYVLLM